MTSIVNATADQNSDLFNLFNALWLQREQSDKMVPLIIPSYFHNGTGYMDGARNDDLNLKVGKIGHGVDEMGRRVLVIPAVANLVNGYKNVVIHDRFSPEETTHPRVVFDFTGLVHPLGRWMEGEQIEALVGVLTTTVTLKMSAIVSETVTIG